VEPEITAAGLAEADPVVLAMVAAHLHPQAPGGAQLQGLRRRLGLRRRRAPLASALIGAAAIQQRLDVLLQGQQVVGLISVLLEKVRLLSICSRVRSWSSSRGVIAATERRSRRARL